MRTEYTIVAFYRE